MSKGGFRVSFTVTIVSVYSNDRTVPIVSRDEHERPSCRERRQGFGRRKLWNTLMLCVLINIILHVVWTEFSSWRSGFNADPSTNTGRFVWISSARRRKKKVMVYLTDPDNTRSITVILRPRAGQRSLSPLSLLKSPSSRVYDLIYYFVIYCNCPSRLFHSTSTTRITATTPNSSYSARTTATH